MAAGHVTGYSSLQWFASARHSSCKATPWPAFFAASHRLRDLRLSPDGRPAKRLSTLISSSNNSHRIPWPSPISSQLARFPRSPIEKSLFAALTQPGGEESSPGRGGGIAVSDGAGRVGPGSYRVRVGVVGRGGGGQRRGPAQIPGNPAVRGQVAARIRVRWATVAVR